MCIYFWSTALSRSCSGREGLMEWGGSVRVLYLSNWPHLGLIRKRGKLSTGWLVSLFALCAFFRVVHALAGCGWSVVGFSVQASTFAWHAIGGWIVMWLSVNGCICAQFHSSVSDSGFLFVLLPTPR